MCCLSLDSYNKVDGVCKSLCEDGRYYNRALASRSAGNETKDNCSECHVSCSTCFGPTKYDCLRCKGVKFRDPSNKLCSLNCPKRGYYEGLATTLCERCPSECVHCINPTTCLECIPGLFLYEKKCISHCPPGFYAENSTYACMRCDKVCESCGGSSTSCTKCYPPLILHKNRCVTKCPSRMFLSKDFNRCIACDYSCLSCAGAGPRRCTSCKPALVLFQAQCRTKCPNRYYHNRKAKSCQPCDYYCRRCSGGE